eukprot:Hpha_TRINITY_DN8329_c1_g1::TRINITY_DN8329_c1_g1_i1::g.154284::m.154284
MVVLRVCGCPELLSSARRQGNRDLGVRYWRVKSDQPIGGPEQVQFLLTLFHRSGSALPQEWVLRYCNSDGTAGEEIDLTQTPTELGLEHGSAVWVDELREVCARGLVSTGPDDVAALPVSAALASVFQHPHMTFLRVVEKWTKKGHAKFRVLLLTKKSIYLCRMDGHVTRWLRFTEVADVVVLPCPTGDLALFRGIEPEHDMLVALCDHHNNFPVHTTADSLAVLLHQAGVLVVPWEDTPEQLYGMARLEKYPGYVASISKLRAFQQQQKRELLLQREHALQEDVIVPRSDTTLELGDVTGAAARLCRAVGGGDWEDGGGRAGIMGMETGRVLFNDSGEVQTGTCRMGVIDTTQDGTTAAAAQAFAVRSLLPFSVRAVTGRSVRSDEVRELLRWVGDSVDLGGCAVLVVGGTSGTRGGGLWCPGDDASVCGEEVLALTAERLPHSCRLFIVADLQPGGGLVSLPHELPSSVPPEMEAGAPDVTQCAPVGPRTDSLSPGVVTSSFLRRLSSIPVPSMGMLLEDVKSDMASRHYGKGTVRPEIRSSRPLPFAAICSIAVPLSSPGSHSPARSSPLRGYVSAPAPVALPLQGLFVQGPFEGGSGDGGEEAVTVASELWANMVVHGTRTAGAFEKPHVLVSCGSSSLAFNAVFVRRFLELWPVEHPYLVRLHRSGDARPPQVFRCTIQCWTSLQTQLVDLRRRRAESLSDLTVVASAQGVERILDCNGDEWQLAVTKWERQLGFSFSLDDLPVPVMRPFELPTEKRALELLGAAVVAKTSQTGELELECGADAVRSLERFASQTPDARTPPTVVVTHFALASPLVLNRVFLLRFLGGWTVANPHTLWLRDQGSGHEVLQIRINREFWTWLCSKATDAERKKHAQPSFHSINITSSAGAEELHLWDVDWHRLVNEWDGVWKVI